MGKRGTMHTQHLCGLFLARGGRRREEMELVWRNCVRRLSDLCVVIQASGNSLSLLMMDICQEDGVRGQNFNLNRYFWWASS